MTGLVRIIFDPPRGEDGLFIQPRQVGPSREAIEAHNRERFANHFNYADPFAGNTRTFDQQGNYNCGRCNMADDEFCLLLEEPADIDLTAGSCRHWENTYAADAEMMLHRESRAVASYGVAANGQGFGCHRCPFASAAYESDSLGRNLYCGEGDFRIFPYACCELNGAPLNGDGLPAQAKPKAGTSVSQNIQDLMDSGMDQRKAIGVAMRNAGRPRRKGN